MRRLELTSSARQDLKETWEYIAQNNLAAANKVVKSITDKFPLLCDHPLMGSRRDDLLINLRSISVKKYIIFYQPFDDRIEILHVLHSSRDIKSVFERFFDSL